jgi:hypothetical protein
MDFKYSLNDDGLNRVLSFALGCLISDELMLYGVPGVSSLLSTLFEERGVGHETGVEIDAFPKNKNNPIDLFLVSYREDGLEDAGLFTLEELRQGIRDELSRQVIRSPEYKEAAQRIAEKFNLN